MTPTDLRERREALNLTQAQLAEALDIHQPHVSDWESGKRRITRMRAAWFEQEFQRLESERQPA